MKTEILNTNVQQFRNELLKSGTAHQLEMYDNIFKVEKPNSIRGKDIFNALFVLIIPWVFGIVYIAKLLVNFF